MAGSSSTIMPGWRWRRSRMRRFGEDRIYQQLSPVDLKEKGGVADEGHAQLVRVYQFELDVECR